MTTPPRLRVLHVIYKVQPTNGQFNEHCLPLADERDITVCSFRPSTLPIPPTIRAFEGDGTFVGGVRAMKRALSGEADGYDVVHVHAAQTAAILLVVLAASRRWALRRRAVYTVQNSYQNYRRRNRLLMALSFPWYPQVVFCSRSALESMPPLFRRLVRGRSHVVPNCVDLAAIDRALSAEDPAPVPARPGTFRVVAVGRLMPIKDMATTIRAVARSTVDPIELVVVGDGPLREELGAEAHREGIAERVSFTGLLERAAVYRQLATADAVVSASHGEGLPVAVVESLACARPVVLTDIAPHRELGEGFDGIRMFGIGDTDTLARHLVALAATPAAERDELGRAGRRHVEARYGLDAMHRNYEPIYSVAAGRPVTTLISGGPRSEP